MRFYINKTKDKVVGLDDNGEFEFFEPLGKFKRPYVEIEDQVQDLGKWDDEPKTKKKRKKIKCSNCGGVGHNSKGCKAQGGMPMPPLQLVDKLLTQDEEIDLAEDIFARLQEGKTSKEIADDLDISLSQFNKIRQKHLMERL